MPADEKRATKMCLSRMAKYKMELQAYEQHSNDSKWSAFHCSLSA